ncbi:MAG: c-type cytochrome [Bacteroidota bacterium]
MKKLVFLFAVGTMAVTIIACGPKEKKNTEEFNVNESTETKPAVDLVAMGDALVKASDCKTCHHPVNKIIGPSHTDVAKKYEFTEANVKMLAQKIIAGGQGNWGEIPMAAHADISTENAENMARYVLSLDGEKEH